MNQKVANMKKNILFLFLVVLCAGALNASPRKNKPDEQFKREFIKATAMLYDENYVEALKSLLILDSLKPENANIQFQMGLCYLNSRTKHAEAVKVLEEAVGNTTTDYREGYFKEEAAPALATRRAAADVRHEVISKTEIRLLNDRLEGLRLADERLSGEAGRLLRKYCFCFIFILPLRTLLLIFVLLV